MHSTNSEDLKPEVDEQILEKFKDQPFDMFEAFERFFGQRWYKQWVAKWGRFNPHVEAMIAIESMKKHLKENPRPMDSNVNYPDWW